MTSKRAPPHEVSEEDGSRIIDIGAWKITATSKSIVTAAESDNLTKLLDFPLPEMTFGNNALRLRYKRGEREWVYQLDTVEALKLVKNGELGEGDGGVKVGYAEEWLKSRTDPGSALPLPKTGPTKAYDWTYTTTYPGHIVSNSTSNAEGQFVPADPENIEHKIPLAELTRPDPILFYSEIPLYEDELHDNGSSHISVRLRVMPQCFFILARFTLRVDNVLFRNFDTRIYHSFSSSPPLLIRETSGREAPYEEVKKCLPKKDDLNVLTDHNFIARSLTDIATNQSAEFAGTGWRGLKTTTEIVYI